MMIGNRIIVRQEARVTCDSDDETSSEHGGGHEDEDEDVDVDADSEDEEDSEQGEGDDDLLHDLGQLDPPPPDPHAQGSGQDQHEQGSHQLCEWHHQIRTSQIGTCEEFQHVKIKGKSFYYYLV